MKIGSTDELSLGSIKDIEITFPLVPEDTDEMLNEKERFDYEENRRDFATWMLQKGQNPSEIEGYTEDTTKRTMYRTAYAERVIWRHVEDYISILDHDHADQYIEALAYSDHSQTHKNSCLHSLKRYFKWRHHKYGEELWDPDRTFESNGNGHEPQDYFTKKERKLLRENALDIGTIPAYKTVKCEPERRERLYQYLSEYHEKPVDDVSPDDFTDVPSWKLTTLVWTSLDAGFRPAEVAKAKTSWLDLQNQRFLIPKEDSTKNEGHWDVALHPKTATALENWQFEREHYPIYDDTDKLWLTTHGNPYNSRSLRRLIRRVCDEAGINTENRKISWYSLRHSVGTYMTKDRGMAAAKEQLRHKQEETTMKYDAAPAEDRSESLLRMG